MRKVVIHRALGNGFLSVATVLLFAAAEGSRQGETEINGEETQKRAMIYHYFHLLLLSSYERGNILCL